MLALLHHGGELAQQADHVGHLLAHADLQVAREAAARIGQVEQLLCLHAQATAEVVQLQAPGDDDEFVVLEQIAIGIERVLVHRGLDHARAVIDLEQAQPPALAIDGAEVADDAGQGLGLAAVAQLGQRCAHEAAHLLFDLVEQMARQVKAHGGLFLGQPLLHAPGQGIGQGRLLGAGAHGVLAHHVEQPALVGIGQRLVGELEGMVDGGHQGRAVQFDGIEGTALDQGFQRALVQARAVHAHAEVGQALERPLVGAARAHATAFTGRDDGLDGLLARALDGTQAIAYDLVGDGLEAVHAAVDIRRLEADAHLERVFVQHLELVGVVHFHGHVPAVELGRVVHLQPGRVIGQQRVGGGVRLVEAVARELLHQVEDLVGLFLADALLGRALAEDPAVHDHFLDLLFAHGTAQEVGAAQRVAAQHLGRLHHLLLVDHDPVGFGQHLFDQRMRILHHFLAVLARHEAGNQVHGSRAVQGVQGDQVFQPAGLGVAQHALHAARFKLEHGLGLALGKQLVGARIVQRDVLECEVLLALVALDDELARNLQDGQRGQAQKVELHQAHGLHIVLVVHGHGRVAARLLVQRAEIGQLARGNHHAARVHADVACHAFELLGHFNQCLDVFFFVDALGQHGLGLDGVGVLVALLLRIGRVLERDVQARLVGNELGDAIAEGVAHVQHAAHVADGRARGHGAEGGDLADGVAAVQLLHVVDDAVAVGLAEVHVEVGHGHTLGVEETLEQQVVFQRVQVRDLEHVGHQRAGARSAARTHGTAVELGPLDEVAHDEEVARKAHLEDGADLELQSLDIALALGLALGGVGIEMDQAFLQSRKGLLAEELVHGHAFGHGEVGQLRLAQHQRQAAATRDFHGVGDGAGNVGKQRLHLRDGLEMLVAREAAHTLGVGQDLALGDAHARLVRFVVVGAEELYGVRGDHGQVQAIGQLHGGQHMGFVVRPACALQLDEEAVREHARQPLGDGCCAGLVTAHQCLAHRAGLGAGQHDQAFAQLLQPGPCVHGLALDHIAGPAPGQQLGQVVVAQRALHQHDDARDRGAVFALDLDFRAQHGLDALGPAFAIELDAAKQVVEVCDGQCDLPILGGGLDDGVDAVGSVHDGKFGVQAQMDKHMGAIVESSAMPGPVRGHAFAAAPACGAGIAGRYNASARLRENQASCGPSARPASLPANPLTALRLPEKRPPCSVFPCPSFPPCWSQAS